MTLYAKLQSTLNKQLGSLTVGKDLPRMARKIHLFHYDEESESFIENMCNKDETIEAPTLLYNVINHIHVNSSPTTNSDITQQTFDNEVDVEDHQTITNFLLNHFGENGRVTKLLKATTQGAIITFLPFVKFDLDKKGIHFKDGGTWEISIYTTNGATKSKPRVVHLRREEVYSIRKNPDEIKKFGLFKTLFTFDWEIQINFNENYEFESVQVRFLKADFKEDESEKYKQQIETIQKQFTVYESMPNTSSPVEESPQIPPQTEENESSLKDTKSERITQLAFLVEGIGAGFVWNVLLTSFTCPSYEYSKSSINMAMIVLILPQLFTILLLLKLRNYFSAKIRVVFGHVLSFCMVLGLCVFSHLLGDLSLGFVIPCLIVLGASIGLVQATLYELASKFPKKFVHIFNGGIGLGGIFALASSWISFPFSNRLATSLIIPTVASGIFSIISCLVFIGISKLDYFRTILKIGNQSEIEKKPLLSKRSQQEPFSYKKFFSETYLIGFYLFFVKCTTFLIFPGLTSLIQSEKFSPNLLPFIFTTVFISCDFIGRASPRFFELAYPLAPKYLPIFIARANVFPIIFRIVFDALIILCIYPKWIPAEFGLVFVALLAFTNGYHITSQMRFLNSMQTDKGMVGIWFSFLQNFGIFCGCLIGFLISLLLE